MLLPLPRILPKRSGLRGLVTRRSESFREIRGAVKELLLLWFRIQDRFHERGRKFSRGFDSVKVQIVQHENSLSERLAPRRPRREPPIAPSGARLPGWPRLRMDQLLATPAHPTQEAFRAIIV